MANKNEQELKRSLVNRVTEDFDGGEMCNTHINYLLALIDDAFEAGRASAASVGEGVPDGLREFANILIGYSYEDNGVDAEEIREIAIQCGLIKMVTRPVPCGTDCNCARYSADFPTRCMVKSYQTTPPAGDLLDWREHWYKAIDWVRREYFTRDLPDSGVVHVFNLMYEYASKTSPNNVAEFKARLVESLEMDFEEHALDRKLAVYIDGLVGRIERGEFDAGDQSPASAVDGFKARLLGALKNRAQTLIDEGKVFRSKRLHNDAADSARSATEVLRVVDAIERGEFDKETGE